MPPYSDTARHLYTLGLKYEVQHKVQRERCLLDNMMVYAR